MRLLTLFIILLFSGAALAIDKLKGMIPPTGVQVKAPPVRQGWILVVPTDEKATAPQGGFQLPKDWMSQRPAGVPPSNDGPYLIPAPPLASAFNGSGAVVQAFPSYSPNSQATDNLVKKQTEAIKFLSERIDKLEARIEKLVSPDGKKK